MECNERADTQKGCKLPFQVLKFLNEWDGFSSSLSVYTWFGRVSAAREGKKDPKGGGKNFSVWVTLFRFLCAGYMTMLAKESERGNERVR